MKKAELELNPASLPAGTRVGPWQAIDWGGQGAYGTVYRAVRTGSSPSGPVALKLAHYPEDGRFAREAALLARIRHPNVPNLLDAGHWNHPSGAAYPYLAMEWVDGLSLYTWARTHLPSSRQVFRVLAQVARALEATHAVGGVHRDVKGGNVRIRSTDGRAVLLDFGSGNYTDAEPLTRESLPPGTRPYRSPEAWAFGLRHAQHPAAHYAAQPSDDVFALGVSAYRLVTGQYPPSAIPGDKGASVWEPAGAGPPPPLTLNPRVETQLNVLILRMLSVDPQARGGAGELAVLLERAAKSTGSGMDEPLFPGEAPLRPAPVSAKALSRRHSARQNIRKKALLWKWLCWLASPALGLFLSIQGAPEPPHSVNEVPVLVQSETPDAGLEDGGTAALAHTALTDEPAWRTLPSPPRRGLGLDIPKTPFPGQQRPPCTASYEVEIRGGCWTQLAQMAPCKDSYEWKGRCYIPSAPAPREPTSDKP
ncbi:serine/threonine-protein kinase [Stigmatella sp. ncwal1]|uniref:Serine/threonine-protein kinase n=1 Tax=Stigmatella ashevillensis TaxID=2995309 RepID=A0ABT5D7B1_9BACT|nr:serine/threonine-protein kinase [Stigmatella ashevillena]MDC0709544.1 serine/threonine-protein kinase [Stigmatella ashevillena]